MLATWKNKMIEQGLNYSNSTNKKMTYFLKTRIENLEPREDKKRVFYFLQEKAG